MLGRQAIIDRYQLCPGKIRQLGADRIMAVKRTDDEAAAMDVVDAGLRRNGRRPIAPDRDAAIDEPILAGETGRARRIEFGAKRVVPLALLLDRGIDRIGRIERLAAAVKGEDPLLRRHRPLRHLVHIVLLSSRFRASLASARPLPVRKPT
ncbi:hypothetical protein D9M70_527180 [compost metagenome]